MKIILHERPQFMVNLWSKQTVTTSIPHFNGIICMSASIEGIIVGSMQKELGENVKKES